MNIPKDVGIALEIAAAAAVGVTLAGIGVGVGLAAIVAVKLLSGSSSPETDEKVDLSKKPNAQLRNDKKAPVEKEKQTQVAPKNPQKERSASLNVAKSTDSLPPMPLTPPAIPNFIGSTVKDTSSLPVRKPSVQDRKNDDLPLRNTESSRRVVEQRVPTGIREWRASVIENKETKNTNVATAETRVDRDEVKYPAPPTDVSDISSDDWLHIGSTATLVSSSQERITSHESSAQTTAVAVVSAEPALVSSTAETIAQPSSFNLPTTKSSSLTAPIVVHQAALSKNVASVAQPEQFTSSVMGPTTKEELPALISEAPTTLISPLPELPPSRTVVHRIPQLPVSSRVQEKQRETSLDSQEATANDSEPVVPISHPMETSFMSAVSSFSEPESPEPASSDASGASTSAAPSSILQKQPSVSRKRRPSTVASAAKKVSDSVKGAFKDPKSVDAGSSKANPAGLTSPSNDSLSSAQSHGKEGFKDYTTSPSRESLSSNKSGRSMLSAAKDGVKRMLSTKDKSRSTSPFLEPTSYSVDTQEAPSSSSALPLAAATGSSGTASKKKQRQQQAATPDAGNASPMLKGMFKGRKPTKTSA